MPFIESLNEFCERQRCTPLTVRDRYLFPNGAQSDGHTHSDPPEDANELLVLRYEYARAKLDGAIHRYNRDRDCIAEQAHFHSLGAGPSPAEGWQEHLKTLAAEIEQLQGEALAIQQQLPRSRSEQNYNHRRSENQKRAADVVAALAQLPVY